MIRLAPLSWLPRTLCIALLAPATTPRAQSESRLEPQPESLPAGYRVETIEETVDDNPRFDSSLLTPSPAPPSHFLRVFGQPSRAGLGEFRDESPSLRQSLMMVNGKATHEAD